MLLVEIGADLDTDPRHGEFTSSVYMLTLAVELELFIFSFRQVSKGCTLLGVFSLVCFYIH